MAAATTRKVKTTRCVKAVCPLPLMLPPVYILPTCYPLGCQLPSSCHHFVALHVANHVLSRCCHTCCHSTTTAHGCRCFVFARGGFYVCLEFVGLVVGLLFAVGLFLCAQVESRLLLVVWIRFVVLFWPSLWRLYAWDIYTVDVYVWLHATTARWWHTVIMLSRFAVRVYGCVLEWVGPKRSHHVAGWQQ